MHGDLICRNFVYQWIHGAADSLPPRAVSFRYLHPSSPTPCARDGRRRALSIPRADGVNKTSPHSHLIFSRIPLPIVSMTRRLHQGTVEWVCSRLFG
jgi:hypothetical protein